LEAGDALVHLLLVAHHEAAPLEVPPISLGVGTTHLQTSQDGLNWTVSPLAGCGNAVLWDGTRYVAVGTSTSLAGQRGPVVMARRSCPS
jgi:hypothetical protein